VRADQILAALVRLAGHRPRRPAGPFRRPLVRETSSRAAWMSGEARGAIHGRSYGSSCPLVAEPKARSARISPEWCSTARPHPLPNRSPHAGTAAARGPPAPAAPGSGPPRACERSPGPASAQPDEDDGSPPSPPRSTRPDHQEAGPGPPSCPWPWKRNHVRRPGPTCPPTRIFPCPLALVKPSGWKGAVSRILLRSMCKHG
jgi:hypothetical protein